jgi:hypothetical protein
MAGVVALLLLALSSRATTPAPTDTAPGKGASCHGAYLADVDTGVPGEATPEAAAVAWAKSVNAPPGAPTDGWQATDERKERSRERTVRSGDWIVGRSSTAPVGWVVSGLGCGVTQGEPKTAPKRSGGAELPSYGEVFLRLADCGRGSIAQRLPPRMALCPKNRRAAATVHCSCVPFCRGTHTFAGRSAFRGAFLTGFARRFKPFAAVVLSAALFASIHLVLLTVAYLFALGIALALICRFPQQNLWAPYYFTP